MVSAEDYESFLRDISSNPGLLDPFDADTQTLILNQVLYMERTICIGSGQVIPYDQETLESVWKAAQTIGYP